MEDIGIRELKAQASEIIRRVKDEGERYVVTHRGKPVAILTPIEEALYDETDLSDGGDLTVWDELIRLGNEIGQAWISANTDRDFIRYAQVEENMTGPYAIDASFFLNAFIPVEAGYADSRQLLERLQRDGVPLIAPTLVLPETAAAIGRGKGDPRWGIRFSQMIGRLPGLVLVTLDRKLAQQSSEIAAKYRLRGSDAVYVATAFRFNCSLITLDKEQHDRVAKVINAYYPNEIQSV